MNYYSSCYISAHPSVIRPPELKVLQLQSPIFSFHFLLQLRQVIVISLLFIKSTANCIATKLNSSSSHISKSLVPVVPLNRLRIYTTTLFHAGGTSYLLDPSNISIPSQIPASSTQTTVLTTFSVFKAFNTSIRSGNSFSTPENTINV